MPTSTRLRDLVRDIRSARTAAEERTVVNRECAQIRDNFREEDSIYRCRNVAKLLYIHMLGYSAHFGQLDCLKLIASSKFTDKRIGYLGAMLLLDERTDIHVLVTNSLKNDLNHTNQYIVSLALCTLGSICSTEMSRDLVTEVEKLIKSSNAYLRKKAILCAFRMIRKVPDLIELFIPATRSLLNEKNHGVLITAATLITEMCQRSPDTLSFFRRMVPNLVRILKNLIMSGYSPEHDVNGVSDPFLQVKVLKLLRIVGKGDHEASDAMNDILAQVATNTDTSKNVGHAILYEIVLTIMGVESEAGLRVLAVNILGRFLLNNDKNIRYVALNTLQQVVNVDYKAVQRHRSTIVDCLLDPDVSIQRRAMELCFVLINNSNIRGMTKELLAFLHRCEPEFKADTCSNLVLAAEKYAPNKTWHFETMLQLLTTAGNFARDDVLSSLVALISQTTAMHAYAVLRLYSAMLHDMSQQPLIQVASWCIGEYGEHLITAQNIIPIDDEANTEPNTITNSDSNGQVITISIPNCKTPVSENEILSILEKALLSSSVTQYTKQIIQMSLVKLSTRTKSESSIKLIRQLICVHSTSINLELQQRSVEFSSIFRNYDNLRLGLLESMPVMETRVLSGTLVGNHDINMGDSANTLTGQINGYGSEIITDVADNKASNAGQLLDLLSLTDPIPADNVPSTDTNQNGVSQAPSAAGSNIFDLLGDLSLYNDPVPTTNHKSPAEKTISLPNEQKSTIPSIIVYESNHGLKLTFSFEKISTTQSTVTLHATNNGNQLIDQFLFQAAVPKSFQLVLLAPSSDSLMPFGGSLTQLLKLSNPNKQPWKMKIRLQYRLNGELKSVQHQLDTFPSDLWT